jgi:CBS domain-containing protein
MKRISVTDVMKTDFGTIDSKATIMDALNEMKQLQTAVLVVNKKNEDDEYGLILVSDIARLVLARDKAPSRMNVYEIMTKPAVCVDPNMDIRYCSRLMSSLNLTRVLVVQDNELLGTVSPRALVLEGLIASEVDD